MTTIYSINAEGQERYDTIRPERVAEVIKRLRRQGALEVRVIPGNSVHPVVGENSPVN